MSVQAKYSNKIIHDNKSNNSFIRYFKKNKVLYFMMIPGLLFFLVYKYLPMAGVLIAFKDYNIMDGVFKSQWVGVKYFEMMFKDPYFWRVFRNTLIISIYKQILSFPAPIIFALLLNELRNVHYKKIVQSISYIPHFISWVVAGGIFIHFFYRSGFVNNIIIEPLIGRKIDFFAEEKYFRSILVSTYIWKTLGWDAIIYLAALAGVNPELYESSYIDGAGKIKQVWYITLPSILNIVVIVFILNFGGLLSAGFEQVFVLYNPLVYSVSDIIDTFVYRVGLVKSDYSYSTAVGLFKSIIGTFMMLLVNRAAKSLGQEGIW